MNSLFVRLKVIVKLEDKYLVLRHWVDDRIVDPYSWEFIDTELELGESPEHGALRSIKESTGLDCEIVRPLYTWSNMLGERQCVGIAFLARLDDKDPVLTIGDEYCGYEWITLQQLEEFIDNKYVIKDLHKHLSYLA